MTETVAIGGASYTYTTEVRNDDAHRAAFFALAMDVFGLDFGPWHAGGWWDETLYMPHLLLDGAGRAVANISANRMAMVLEGAPRLYVQLGTVMTAGSHRLLGLGRWLMERVLAEWRGRCDSLYLHANAEAAGFYGRLGFAPAPERELAGPLPGRAAGGAAGREGAKQPPVRRLDMADAGDRALLLACYAKGNPYSALAFAHNPGLLMFHCAGPLRDCLFHIPACGTALVALHSGESLHLADVYGPGDVPLAEIAAAAARPGNTGVVYGFTPLAAAGLAPRPLADDGVLMIQKGGEDPFAARPLMLPMLSHA